MLDDLFSMPMDPFHSLGLLSSVAFFSRACTRGKVCILLTFINEITNGIKG